jgi:hypothetical protein
MDVVRGRERQVALERDKSELEAAGKEAVASLDTARTNVVGDQWHARQGEYAL